ncbi:MAG: helix-turn-helix transcriptional regulator [Phycisphaerales bacterium]|jgi:transcriptional regulator with XRE-family HTH domain
MTADTYRASRQRLGLTQEQLAARLGVTRRTIGRREQHGNVVNFEAALAMSYLCHEARALRLKRRLDFYAKHQDLITSNIIP